jgi:hypothetical protein
MRALSPRTQGVSPLGQRIRKNTLHPVAVAPTMAAEVMGVRRKEIFDAVRAGLIPVYRIGIRRRILVVDLISWARDTWLRLP